MRILAPTIGVVAAFVVGGAFVWLEGYRVNLSRSLPLGIYRLTDREPVVGGLVAFCVPARISHMDVFDHLTVTPCVTGSFFGVPLLKRIASISSNGDLVVRGESERSVDSRTFGPIRHSEITGVVDVVFEF